MSSKLIDFCSKSCQIAYINHTLFYILHKKNKEVSQQNRIIFTLWFYLYNTVQKNVTIKGFSSCVLAIASILFSNYLVLFYNVHNWLCLFLESNIITNDAQKEITVYIFQLTSFEHNNLILFQFFLKKSDKLIGRGS